MHFSQPLLTGVFDFMVSISSVVIVNGWSAHNSLWDRAAEVAKESLNCQSVQVVDLRGDVFKKLQSIIRNENGRVLLIAWSLGAQYAIEFLSKFEFAKDKVSALVALQANPCFVERSDWSYGYNEGLFNSLLKLTLTEDKERLVRTFFHLLLKGRRDTSDIRLLKQAYKVDLLPSSNDLIDGLDALRKNDLRKELGELQVPVLWILSENDALVKHTLRQFLVGFEAIELVELSNAAHLPCGSVWPEIVDEIKRFCERL